MCKYFAICSLLTLLLTPSASAIVIDDFSDGTIVDAPATPSQLVDQPGVSGVIATGDRRANWTTTGGPGTANLDINNLVPGRATLTVSPDTVGSYLFVYGHNSPFDLDLTASGGDAFVIDFGFATAGSLSVFAFDVDGSINSQLASIDPLPSGGQIVVPFSIFDPAVDFQHIKEVLFSINTATGGSYEIRSLATRVVPEPASIVTFALGLIGLAAYRFSRWAR